jgi:HTH-type transcriptional regulator, sugar sensing transcriptional regulator
MKLSQAIEALQRIGLSRYEATVFANLARSGVATAGELARICGVNRVQTYRALESLEARGLVEVTLDRPRRYAAPAIRDLFEMIAEEKRAELDKVDAVRKSLVEAWPSISRRPKEPPSVRLQVIKGRSQIYRRLREFVSTSKEEVLAFTTTKGLLRSYRAGINNALVAAMRRGVKPRLAADIDRANVALMERVAEYVPLRHVDRQRARFIIVDRESILAFLIQDEETIRGDGETALWTNSADFVKAHLDFFEKAWSRGIPATRRIHALGRKAARSRPT